MLPGDAFGEQEAGPQPDKPVIENVVTKELRKLGFPETQNKAAASSLADKVMTGINKRLGKIDEMITKMSDVNNPNSLITKTLICEKYIVFDFSLGN